MNLRHLDEFYFGAAEQSKIINIPCTPSPHQKNYPPWNNQIYHQGKRKIIDSKVQTVKGYVSSQESRIIVVVVIIMMSLMMMLTITIIMVIFIIIIIVINLMMMVFPRASWLCLY